MKLFFLNLLAVCAIISSILVITSKNPVIAVLFLISVFVNSAGYLILLGIGFVGISYIIVYVGAITVLFLFVIMLLNIRLSEIIETNKNYTKNLPLALFIGSLFLFEMFTIIPFSINDLSIISLMLNLINSLNSFLVNTTDINNLFVLVTNNPIIADTNFNNFLQIQALGHNLYTFGSIWLIITSIILLLAMIAPLFLTNIKTNQN